MVLIHHFIPMKLPPVKRVLLKISGEALEGKKSYGIDVDFLQELSRKIAELRKRENLEIVIVIGGGNIFRGVSGAASGLDRTAADYMGMLATILNGIALGNALESIGESVRIMSALEIPQIAELFIYRRAIKHLSAGRIVIAVAGTGNPYFTTDSAAVLRALELHCDAVIKATKVDGVYDKDPEKFSDAVRYDSMTIAEAINKDVRVMDRSALALARDGKLPILVCRIEDIEKIVPGSDFPGTIVSA